MRVQGLMGEDSVTCRFIGEEGCLCVTESRRIKNGPSTAVRLKMTLGEELYECRYLLGQDGVLPEKLTAAGTGGSFEIECHEQGQVLRAGELSLDIRSERFCISFFHRGRGIAEIWRWEEGTLTEYVGSRRYDVRYSGELSGELAPAVKGLICAAAVMLSQDR